MKKILLALFSIFININGWGAVHNPALLEEDIHVSSRQAVRSYEGSSVFTLPGEVLISIFSRLENPDLVHASEVCKAWRSWAQDQSVWNNRPVKFTRRAVPKVISGKGGFPFKDLTLFNMGFSSEKRPLFKSRLLNSPNLKSLKFRLCSTENQLVSEVVSILIGHNQLRELCIVPFSFTEVSDLERALETTTHLSSLKLENSKLSAVNKDRIASALRKNRSLRNVFYSSTSYSEGEENIVAACLAHPTLTSLSLSLPRVEDLERYSDFLRNNQTLRELTFLPSPETSSQLPEFLDLLSRALADNSRLHSLNIQNNKILGREEALPSILRILGNETLTELDMTNMGLIFPEEILSGAIAQNSTLKTLKLGANKLGNNTLSKAYGRLKLQIEDVFRSIIAHPTLTLVDLSNNNIKEEVMEEMKSKVPSHLTIVW